MILVCIPSNFTPRKVCKTPLKSLIHKLKGEVSSVLPDVLDTGQVRC